jgi:hypothetical protein
MSNVEWTNVERTNAEQTNVKFYNMEQTNVECPNVKFLQHRTPEHQMRLTSNVFYNTGPDSPLLGPWFRPLGPKSRFHIYNSGPDSPPQVLGDERTELTPG